MADIGALLGEDEPHDELLPYIEALQRWKVWRDNVPLFYTTCVHSNAAWPSRTVQLYPRLHRDPTAAGLLNHALLYGSYGDKGGTAELMLATVAVDDPSRRHQLPSWQALPKGRPPLRVRCTWQHRGDVDRLRYCPGRPSLVAVKCGETSLSLYDIGPALERLGEAERCEEEEAERQAQEEEGGQQEESSGAAGSGGAAAAAAAVTSGDSDSAEGAADGAASASGDSSDESEGEERPGPTAVLASEAQEGTSLAWGSGGGGEPRLFSGVRCGAVGEYAVRAGGSLAEVSVRRGGHDADADVVDVAWGDGRVADTDSAAAAAGPSSSSQAGPGLLATVGTDGRTLVWDPRQPLPVLHAPRCRRDVNAVAWAPASSGGGSAGPPLLATAGDDGIVRVYDARKLSSGSGGGGGGRAAAVAAAAASPTVPLHRLKAHNCKALQLAFSPHSSSLLASADEQGRILLWELDRLQPLAEGLSSRPQLLFVHAGHVLPVDDFGWSTELYGTLASVSGYLDESAVAAVRADPRGGPDLPRQPPAVLVWRPVPDVLPAAPLVQQEPLQEGRLR